MKIDVPNCAGCGEDHKEVEFTKLGRLIRGYFEYWALCANGRGPIFMNATFTFENGDPDPKVNTPDLTSGQKMEQAVASWLDRHEFIPGGIVGETCRSRSPYGNFCAKHRDEECHNKFRPLYSGG